MSLASLVTPLNSERHKQDLYAAELRLKKGNTIAECMAILRCSDETVRLRVRRAIASGDPRVRTWLADRNLSRDDAHANHGTPRRGRNRAD